MKKRVISAEDFPVEPHDYTQGQASPRQDKIYEYIKKHPNCTRKDIYSLDMDDGHVRTALLKMLQSGKLKETFTIIQ